MNSAVSLIRLVAVAAAAIMLGNWFLTEVKKTKAQGLPAYRAYFTLPGFLIIAAMLMPLFLRWLKG